jgi:hypothetical protein
LGTGPRRARRGGARLPHGDCAGAQNGVRGAQGAAAVGFAVDYENHKKLSTCQRYENPNSGALLTIS